MAEVTACDFLCEVMEGNTTSVLLSGMFFVLGKSAIMCEDSQAAPWRGPCEEERFPTHNWHQLTATCRATWSRFAISGRAFK